MSNPALDPVTGAPDPSPPGITLSPRFWVPLGVSALGVMPLLLEAALPLDRVPALILALLPVLFGLFLALQATLLRLRFTDDALLVLRSNSVIRRFPYDQWMDWRIFWSPLPVLFYFRETRSPHLVPILFDATELQEQLRQHLPPDLASTR